MRRGGRRDGLTMKILYVGPDSGTSRQRKFALERLGHDLFLVDPFEALPLRRWTRPWSFKTGALGLEGLVRRYVLAKVGEARFDLVLVDGGELIGAALTRDLRQAAAAIVHFNLDNPFVDRDGARWRLVRRAMPFYDLFVSPRDSTNQAALRAGVKHTLRIDQAADEIGSRRLDFSAQDHVRYDADVVFVGVWMPERGPFMARLIERGVPLRIYGPRWEKSAEYSRIEPYIAGGWVADEAYAKAIQGGKIAIGMLSKGNEDLHTTRTMEVPAMGVLLCAERTSDHMRLYRDGVEAVFWDDADECADQCLALLADPGRLKAIAEAGHRRVIENQAFNEPLMARVIEAALASASTAGQGAKNV